MNRLKRLAGGPAGLQETHRHGEKGYFLAYTLCFLAACLMVFCWFIVDGRTLIWYIDGWKQHYTALVYYGQYLRSAFGSLLSGYGLQFPAWGYNFGEGNSVLGTLHYYGIGDPLAALSVFVPETHMHLFYNAIAIFRLYLAGIAFSFLCFQVGKKSRQAVLAGSMTYVFCYWALLCAARHPFFLNPMIYLPLLILGIEKILGKGRPYLFIGTVCLSALSNFYFFYILVVLVVIYVIARLVTKYRRDIAAMARTVFLIGAYSLLGVLMAAVILLPILYVFLSDARMSTGSDWPLLYPDFYYASLPRLFLQEGSSRWLCLGYSVPVFLAVCMLVPKRKQHGFLILLFLIGAVIIAFPAFGKILSAFSYIGNRWSFAFALLASYTLTAMWPSLIALRWKDALFLGACTAAYLAVCFKFNTLGYGKFKYLAVLLVLSLLILLPVTKGREPLVHAGWKQAALLACVFLSIACNAYQKYYLDGYRSECLPTEQFSNGFPANETTAVKKAIKSDGYSGFARYSGRSQTINAGSVAGIPSTNYYWSISNPSIAEYRKGLDLLEYNQYSYKGYDDRAALLSLSNVRYFVTPFKHKAPAPYGFSYLDTFKLKGKGKYKVYRNDYMLPLAYTYDSYLTADDFESLTGIEKQQAMLQAVILEDKADEFQQASLHLDGIKVPYTAACSSGEVAIQGHAFVVASPGASVTLSFDGKENCETYVAFTGLDFNNLPQYTEGATIELETPKGISKKLYYSNSTSPRTYNGRHDFAANMGYTKEAASSVTIRFSDAGTYSFDDIKVYCQPMDAYAGQLAALQEDTLENEGVSTDRVTGTISLDKPKLLCLSIPFDTGWHAYVDGEPAKLYRANIKNMALSLQAGDHTIELYYEMPMLKAGAVVSVCGFFIFAILVAVLEKKYPGKEVGNHE